MTERIRFLSPKQVYELTNLSPRTQGRLADKGRFPEPIQLFEGSRRIGFVESEVQAWLAARLAAARRPAVDAEPQVGEPASNGHGAEAPARDAPARPPRRKGSQPLAGRARPPLGRTETIT